MYKKKKRKFYVPYVFQDNNGLGYKGCTVTIEKCNKLLNEEQLNNLRKSIIKANNMKDIVILNLIELEE